jgi:hypothetical protein
MPLPQFFPRCLLSVKSFPDMRLATDAPPRAADWHRSHNHGRQVFGGERHLSVRCRLTLSTSPISEPRTLHAAMIPLPKPWRSRHFQERCCQWHDACLPERKESHLVREMEAS